ncbi:hypothetical protein PEBR_07672 [Penicillium brasilianum]|uniref:Uncharacterized protein n=1 Tax=Penicillium brasilianum TaxID=104259 RepID=A0A1S9RW49_PENBI|nr:hypothetical protein PEBR_07672 [Penicillium brasilianum]
MEPSSNSTCDSDPALQICVKCCLEKPIEQFVSRTKAKRPTTWCSDCRYYGNEGRKRWAASRKLRLEGEKNSESQEKVNNGQSAKEREGTATQMFRKTPHRVRPSRNMAPYIVPTETPPHMNLESAYPSKIPEWTQGPMPGQPAAYQIYASPGCVPYMTPIPGNYSLPRALTSFQMVTPPANPAELYPMAWNHGHGPQTSMIQSAQWVAPNYFNAQPAVQDNNGTSTSDAESQASEHATSKNESFQKGTPCRGILNYGILENRFSNNTTSQAETPDPVTVKEKDSDNGDTLGVVSVKGWSRSSSSSGVSVNGLRVQSNGREEEKDKIGEGCPEEKFRHSEANTPGG